VNRTATLWVLLAVVWFGTLGVRPLYKSDESRYGEISREMVASGDWVTPRLNGFKYFEKPPLQYWTTAVLFKVLGEHDWVARLWTALIGFAGIGLVLYAGNRLFSPPAGYYAAAVLAGCPLYVLMSQVNTLDMSVSVFLSAAVIAFLLGHMLLFWVACALAVLSKGLIGIVLPGAALFIYLLVRRDWALIRRVRPVSGAIVFLLIAAPWFILVSRANPEFAHFFFIQEHFQRFTTEMHQRVHPAWYFLPVLLAGIGPWLLPFLAALRPRDDRELFLVIWALVVLAFFSASGSKLPPYILPMFPALALLIGRRLAGDARRGLLIAQSALLVVMSIAGVILVAGFAPDNYADYARWLALASALLGVAAICALVCALRSAITGAVVCLAAGGLIATVLGLAAHRTLSDRFSVASTVAKLAERPSASTPVFAVDMYDHTLPWSLKRTVTMVAHRDELEVAIGWEPQKFIRDLDAFAAVWRATPQAWAFVPAGAVDTLPAKLGIPMQVMARGSQYAIVKKP